MWQTWLLFSTFTVRTLSTLDICPGIACTLEFWFDSYSRNDVLIFFLRVECNQRLMCKLCLSACAALLFTLTCFSLKTILVIWMTFLSMEWGKISALNLCGELHFDSWQSCICVASQSLKSKFVLSPHEWQIGWRINTFYNFNPFVLGIKQTVSFNTTSNYYIFTFATGFDYKVSSSGQ